MTVDTMVSDMEGNHEGRLHGVPGDYDASAKYLAGTGGDYWASLTAVWDNLTTNGDFAMGKMKYVRPEWRWFCAHTLSGSQLRANPPPAEQ